jgi:hypothetical protein
MLHRTWGRALAAAVVLAAPLLASDYDHVFDVVRDAWPDKTVAMALCDKDANQMALIDLADAAKAHNLTMVIVDLKAEKDYPRTITAALTKKPDFLFILEDDSLTGLKGSLTKRLIYRVGQNKIPAVALTKESLQLGVVLAAGAGPKDPVFANKEAAKQMDLTLPSEAVDPGTRKK